VVQRVGFILQEPDVLLLDEPTNHLDLDAIEWLEGYLKKQVSAFGAKSLSADSLQVFRYYGRYIRLALAPTGFLTN
jgi:ABC-type sulfate/molybdate transport systems ATPase subunit